jgi:hypothetical protein
MLLGCLSRDFLNLLHVADHLHVHEIFQCELFCDLEVFADYFFDLIPVVTLEVFVPERKDDRHGIFKREDEVLKFLEDRVRGQSFLTTIDNLRVVLSFIFDFFGVDVDEFAVNPVCNKLLPFFKGLPHGEPEV